MHLTTEQVLKMDLDLDSFMISFRNKIIFTIFQNIFVYCELMKNAGKAQVISIFTGLVFHQAEGQHKIAFWTWFLQTWTPREIVSVEHTQNWITQVGRGPVKAEYSPRKKTGRISIIFLYNPVPYIPTVGVKLYKNVNKIQSKLSSVVISQTASWTILL